jgi:hypothetical protein
MSVKQSKFLRFQAKRSCFKLFDVARVGILAGVVVKFKTFYKICVFSLVSCNLEIFLHYPFFIFTINHFLSA